MARDLHLLDNLVRHVDVTGNRDLARDLHRNRNRHLDLPRDLPRLRDRDLNILVLDLRHRHLHLDFPGHRHVAVLHMRHFHILVHDLPEAINLTNYCIYYSRTM